VGTEGAGADERGGVAWSPNRRRGKKIFPNGQTAGWSKDNNRFPNQGEGRWADVASWRVGGTLGMSGTPHVTVKAKMGLKVWGVNCQWGACRCEAQAGGGRKKGEGGGPEARRRDILVL